MPTWNAARHHGIETLAIFTIAGGVTFLAILFASGQVTGLYHDDGIYIATARSLATSGEYRLTNLPGAPFETKYPPVYPALLAAVSAFRPSFPSDLGVLKSINALCLAITVLLLHGWLRRDAEMTSAVRVAAVLAAAIAPGLFSMTDLVLSELTFVALLMGVVVLDPTRQEGPSNAALLSAGLTGGLAAVTRSVGMAVVLGLIWHVWMRSGRRAAFLTSLASLTAIVPWALFVRVYAAPQNELLTYYVQYESPAWTHLRSDPTLAWRIVSTNAALLASAMPVAFGLLGAGIAVPFVATVAVGATSSGDRDNDLAVKIVFLYILAVLAHPYPMERYLVPLIALGYGWSAKGLCRIGRLMSAGTWAVAVPVVGLLVLNTTWLAHYRSVVRSGVHGEFGRALPYDWHGFEDTIEWISRNTAPDARLASGYDTLYFAYTGRPGVRPWLHQPERYVVGYGLPEPKIDGERLVRDLESLKVDYLVIDPLLAGRESEYGRASLQAILHASPGAWAEVFSTRDRDHVIYRRATPFSAGRE